MNASTSKLCRLVPTLLAIFGWVVLFSATNTSAQIVFPGGEGEPSNVWINMCCDLNLLSSGGSCSGSGSGGSGGNTHLFKTPNERQLHSADADWDVPAQHMTNNERTIFPLLHKQPLCTAGSKIQRLEISEQKVQFQVQPNGTVNIGPNRYHLDLFSLTQYCVNGKGSNFVEVETCVPACTSDEPCIKKCCAMDKVFSPTNTADRNCEEVEGAKWSPLYFRSPKDPKSLLSQEESAKKNPFYSIRHPSAFQSECKQSTTIPLTTASEVPGFGYTRLRMAEDGKVWHRNQHRKWIPMPEEIGMCIDGIQNFAVEPVPYRNTPDEILVFTCPLEEEESRSYHKYYGFLPVVCSFFALLTVIVYAILWEKQNVHGYTIMAYSTTVFFLFIFLGMTHLTTEYNPELRGTLGCKILGTITHFLFISMFSWLTVISLDLWLTFRTMTLSNPKSKGIKRFLMYCGLGLGIPAFMTILAWTLEAVHGDDENSEVKVPQYGVHVCYVYADVLWEYSYATVSILFAINLLFFVQTTWKLVEYRKSTRFATKTAQNRQSYMLYVKLFFMVGILWVFEIISWAISGAHIAWYWLIFDSLNCFQPIWIFFIFVFKYDTISSLGDKIPSIRPCLRPALVLADLCECKRRTRQSTSKPSTDETSALNVTKTTDDRNSSAL